MKISAMIGLAATAVLLAGCEGNSRSLHIYTWSDYISPEVIAKFEKAHNCKVVVDTFDSNETMYAKLKAGGSGYDLITPSSYFVPTMAREKLIVKLDHSRIPNVKANFDSGFADQIIDPTFEYNVPYAVTYTGFMYAKDKVPKGVNVETWKVLENPVLKGKVTLLDDIREVIGAGLMSLGYSLNSKKPEEVEAAVKEVLKWKANIRKFDAESYKTEVPAGATILGHGYSSDVTQVVVGDEEAGNPPRDDIGFALPKEGFTIAFDELVISVAAPNPDLAYEFIRGARSSGPSTTTPQPWSSTTRRGTASRPPAKNSARPLQSGGGFNIISAAFTLLPHGVMVAPQILNLLVKVRVLMRQPSQDLRRAEVSCYDGPTKGY